MAVRMKNLTFSKLRKTPGNFAGRRSPNGGLAQWGALSDLTMGR